MLVYSKAEIENPKLLKSFYCFMTLTFDLQGHGHILCPLVDNVDVHVKTSAL